MKNLNLSSEYYPCHDIQLVQCGQADCTPDHSFGPYIRDFYLLHFVTKGTGTFCIADKEYVLKKGELFFIPPGVLTFYKADSRDPWSYTWIGLRGIMLPKLFYTAGLSKNTPVLTYSEGLLDSLNQILYHAAQDGYDTLNTIGYLYFFANELVKCEHGEKIDNNRQHTYIDAAIKYVNQNIYEPISVSELSDILGIDRSYFCSIFKKHLGISPQQYIMNLKMEKAKIFLETTTIDVKYIADSLGYGDLYTFSHSFKRNTGCSPKEWRKNHHLDTQINSRYSL